MSMPVKGKHHHPSHHHQHHGQQQQHHHHQQQQHQPQHVVGQSVVQHAPQAYNAVAANNPRFAPHGSDVNFHVPGQNYGGQGGQVGGGGGSVGVPGGRGPPPLGGIQNIGQSAAGIPPGGQTGAQQAPPPTQTPGVQSQQPQGPAPTTTPPVHTPSPQEMGKPTHLQAQPPPLQQSLYVANQTRPASSTYYQAGPRQQAPRGLSHRGGQGGGGTQVVGMPGVGGGGSQPAMYPHPGALSVPPGAMFVQGQVPLHPSHPGPHQQPVYTMNSQMQPIQFSGPLPRHQNHQNQQFYQPYQPAILAQNFAYGPSPTTQHAGYYFQTSGPPINLARPGTGVVGGGAPHVGSPLPGNQGTAVVQPGNIQQPTQQPQSMPPMSLPLSQAEVYPGHNGGAQNAAINAAICRKQRRKQAILDIVDPKTGKNISGEIYDDDAATQSGDSSNRETPQPQDTAKIVADFAARVAKAATEEPESSSPAPTSAPETPTSQNVSQSLPSLKIQTNPESDNSSQSNRGPPTPTQSIPIVTPSNSQPLASTNSVQVEWCPKPKEQKPLQHHVKEFQPRSEIKTAPEEPQQIPVVINKEIVSVQSSVPVPSVPVLEPEPVVDVIPSQIAPPQSADIAPSLPSAVSTNVPSVPTPTANSNPVPSREEFPSLESKKSSNSPARRKSHNQEKTQSVAPVTEAPPVNKEPKERKLSERNLNSTGTTPTPVQNQTDHPKPNGDTIGDKYESEAKLDHQRHTDSKATQKQKNKRGNFKNKDLNRKGAEKEGTDMDAFVNTVLPPKPEAKAPEASKVDFKEIPHSKEAAKRAKDIEVEEKSDTATENESKDSQNTDKPTPESTREGQSIDKPTPEPSKESTSVAAAAAESSSVTENNEESSKETTPTIEESEVCKMPVKTVVNDVVDHAPVGEDVELESALVAQKNEENNKVSALRAASEEKQSGVAVIKKENENETPNENDVASKGPAALKYSYKDDQWSPLNKDGKKVYDRDFLLVLQGDPKSRIKPSNLPDMEVVLKENSRNRGTMDVRQFRESNLSRHDNIILPNFLKSSQSARGAITTKRPSQQGRVKSSKPNVIHLSLSLREDVKLRETENAWKPARLKAGAEPDEEDNKTEALYKRVRGVLNKLTPQKFNTLVNQVRALHIDSQERLQGVIDLVFEKAVDEPSFSEAYALMCKELAMMQVSGSDGKGGKEESNVNFRKLIIARCQMEFEKNTADEIVTAAKKKEIEECTDPEKKKELQLTLEEEQRKMRVKSVGNMRFIGELYKQGMLTTNIMHLCIRQLVGQIDEESLECLCKLFSTVGKDLELKNQDLSSYFKNMTDIVNRKIPGKVSSRVRFMLQDVIELRLNKWVPRRDDSAPKTMDQIQKEAETERLDSQMNNSHMNTPRKDDRNANDRKRNRGAGPLESDGWSTPVRSSRQQYSVETHKLKNKPPPMDNLTLGSKDQFRWGRAPGQELPKTITPNRFSLLGSTPNEDRRTQMPLSGSRSTGPRDYGRADFKHSYDGRNSRNGSQQLSSRSSSRDSSLHDSSRSQSMSMPPPQPIKSVPPPASVAAPVNSTPTLTEDELIKKSGNIMNEYLSDTNIDNATVEIRETFDNSTFAHFVRESLNIVLEKSASVRKLFSQLMTHLIVKNILPLPLYLAGFGEVLDSAEELVIDIPKLWVYLAELICLPIAEKAVPFAELKNMMANLKLSGQAGKLLGELFTLLVQEKGPKWTREEWEKSGLLWSDFLSEEEPVNEFLKKYTLDFMVGDKNNSFATPGGQLSMEKIHETLCNLLSVEKGYSFDNINSWISANVGSRASEPQFIKALVTAILKASIEPHNNTWRFRKDKFETLQTLITRYVDVNEELESNCLIAIQEYIHKLEHPKGVLLEIISKLWEDSLISEDAFLAWEKNEDPPARPGKSVAMMALTSFFTQLKEPDDDSSGTEA